MDAGSGCIDFSSLTRPAIMAIAEPIRQTLAATPYKPPESSPVSIKSILESFLPTATPPSSPDVRREALDFCLCCAALASAEGDDCPAAHWVPQDLSRAARAALGKVAGAVGAGDLPVLVEGLMPLAFPLLKSIIQESCVDPSEEDFASGRGKPPVACAAVAARQFRWLVEQVNYPHLGKLCPVVIPCALTALDHWSPEVKDQGMLSFMHLSTNATSAELGWFEDPILDACCKNIASSDELWYHVMEMTVILLTSIIQRNPRSFWYERIFSEMLDHLERQPRNKDRRLSWLLLVEPVFNSMGLVLLAHFRRIFYLFFLWLHADDDETISLTLERLHTVIKLTWIRKSPYFTRLVDELVVVYKEAALRKAREPIRTGILNIMLLLKQCKGEQFENAWTKHRDDPNLAGLAPSLV